MTTTIKLIPDHRRIELTPSEADLWNWACDPMHEFWADAEERRLEGDRAYHPGTAILEARNGVGSIADDRSVADDLIYRLETQMRDMAIGEGSYDVRGRADKARMDALRSIATGKNLATKVRAAFGIKEGATS